MSYALSLLLIVAVTLSAGVYGIINRYQVIHETSEKVVLIDTWEVKNPSVIERGKNNKWVKKEVITGGESVYEFELEDQNKKTPAKNAPPAI